MSLYITAFLHSLFTYRFKILTKQSWLTIKVKHPSLTLIHTLTPLL